MDRPADAHLKRQIMGREVVVSVTSIRLDGSTEAPPELVEGVAEVFGTWERIFCVSWMADAGV
jgi:hypothetical protein